MRKYLLSIRKSLWNCNCRRGYCRYDNWGVCFSTQKVRYAPVINGKNIFTDAYITKRYTITYDKITGRMSYSINNASYKSNRGDSPSMIVLNAQVAEMGSR